MNKTPFILAEIAVACATIGAAIVLEKYYFALLALLPLIMAYAIYRD